MKVVIPLGLDGLPVAVDNCVLALYRCPSLRTADFSVASLYEVLRSDAGVSPTRAECTLESTSAGPSIAPLLDLRPDEPVLVSRQTTYDRNGVPVETSRIVYRGDRYRFRSTLTA